MLSYKQWRMLNESIGSSFALGLATPSNLGTVGSLGIDLDEAKMKKMKKSKKMHDIEIEDETGDGEMVDAASEKDEPDVDAEELDGGCHHCGKMAKKNMKKMKKSKKMWSDEDDMGGEDVPDEEMEDDDLESAEEETGEDLDGDEEEGEDMAHKEKVMGPMFSKKKSKKGMKAESAEEDEWWASVKSMLGPAPNTKYSDGWSEYHEDALLPPNDPNAQVSQEPSPGDVGFAPQQRLGSNFEEWRKAHGK